MNSVDNKSKQKYGCEKCNYYTNNKRDYNKHLNTKKHNKDKDFVREYTCICNKTYKTASSLSRHRRTCPIYNAYKQSLEYAKKHNIQPELLCQGGDTDTDTDSDSDDDEDESTQMYDDICMNNVGEEGEITLDISETAQNTTDDESKHSPNESNTKDDQQEISQNNGIGVESFITEDFVIALIKKNLILQFMVQSMRQQLESNS